MPILETNRKWPNKKTRKSKC